MNYRVSQMIKNIIFRLSQCLLCWLAISVSNAQQNHYWANQYGARSSLMGGAVVAGVNDNSAIYYNPAAVAGLANTISLNANLYQLSWFNVENGLGNGLDINSSSFDLYPQFAGGTISFKNPRLKAGYMLMTRAYHFLKFDERHEKLFDAIPNIQGSEEFIGTASYLSRANEQWVGLTLAYQVSDKFSIGLTQILGYRFQNFKATVTGEAVTTDFNNFYTAVVRDEYEMSFDNLKAVWKLGFQWNLNPLKIGLTITSPSVNINPLNLSNGRARRESSVANLDRGLTDPEYANYLATDKQDKIPSLYKYPLSVGLGLEYESAKTKIALAAEYFHSLDEYQVLSPQSRPVVRPSVIFRDLATDDFLSFASQSLPVVNFAVGVEHQVNAKWSILAGFRTDYNSYDQVAEDIGDDISYWDLFHLSAGATFHKKQSDITIGLSYYFGVSFDDTQLYNFDSPLDRDYLSSDLSNTANTTTRGISLIVGYTHYLNPRSK
ncbi:hypothetical protein BKI52_28480 [marine bacterium AO1-C]|nr:hypothetical protein BKI52_28480 [marine bacterium AO1-C]